jgi:hypothetical protein
VISGRKLKNIRIFKIYLKIYYVLNLLHKYTLISICNGKFLIFLIPHSSCQILPTFYFFFKNAKVVVIGLQNSHRFFCGISRWDVSVLTGIISKCVTNFKLKFFQVNSFLFFLKFLISHRTLIKYLKFYFMM